MAGDGCRTGYILAKPTARGSLSPVYGPLIFGVRDCRVLNLWVVYLDRVRKLSEMKVVEEALMGVPRACPMEAK